MPSEDTETDELWASLEAAAKRKLCGPELGTLLSSCWCFCLVLSALGFFPILRGLWEPQAGG